MTKILIFPLVLLVLSRIILLQTNKPQGEYFTGNTSDTMPAQEKVYIDVLPHVIKSLKESIVLIIHNNKKGTISFGSDFILEKFINNNWQKQDFKENVAFNSIGWHLQPEKTVKDSINLNHLFSDLTTGRYRISKKFKEGSKNTVDAVASAEFMVDN